ncbi:hypothetical protein PUL39_030325 [Pseudomonas aeruginosa]|uniref:hypothetical protein n=1 Tax=Pseudomonas aeruginosa TaxID=287 RepID=UPI0023AEDB65|nr:hypothetical protein [Pseudomonas aeruginosa]MDE8660743.1 hypothetical protein [Pseudomonas aeruginosa]
MASQKDQQLVELKTGIHKLDRMLVKLIDLFIAGDFSKLHAELQSKAAYLQEQRAAQKSRKEGALMDSKLSASMAALRKVVKSPSSGDVLAGDHGARRCGPGSPAGTDQ